MAWGEVVGKVVYRLARLSQTGFAGVVGGDGGGEVYVKVALKLIQQHYIAEGLGLGWCDAGGQGGTASHGDFGTLGATAGGEAGGTEGQGGGVHVE